MHHYILDCMCAGCKGFVCEDCHELQKSRSQKHIKNTEQEQRGDPVKKQNA